MAKRFLPERYLAGSIEQRLELLRGLCDHRGRLRRGGRVRLSLPSEPLVDGVVLLVRSLGGRVDRRGCVSRRTIEFILPARMVPFGVRDLAEPYRQEWSADLARRCLVRRIRSITPTGHAEAVGCVSVRSASATFVTVDGLVSCNSAKSTVLGLLLAWAIGRHAMVGRLLRILYVSYSLPVSRGKSATIKNTIQSKAYQEVFPMVALSKDATSNELWSIDYHKAGILGSIASKRANLVCPDDLIKSRNAIKKLETRQEMEKNWLEVIEPTMFEGSRVFSLGTRFHSGDIFGTTFTEEHGWQVLRQKALLYDEDGTPRSYWPERFTTEFLLKKQLKNEFIFSYQFQNEAIQSNEAGMSEGLIVKGEVPDQYDELAVSIDLSAGMSERNDFTVMTLAGIADDVCYLIDFRRLKAVGNIEKLNALYNLNVRGIPNSGDKMTHLRAAVGLMQRRKIVFNRFRRWDVYTNEILHFGYTDHDDCVDGLTLLTRHWRRRLGAEVW
jgi:phage terminase large subunit-like protein